MRKIVVKQQFQAGTYLSGRADRDFLRLAEREGAPPQVIQLEAMDYPTDVAATLIRKYALAITEFGQSSRATLILRNQA